MCRPSWRKPLDDKYLTPVYMEVCLPFTWWTRIKGKREKLNLSCTMKIMSCLGKIQANEHGFIFTASMVELYITKTMLLRHTYMYWRSWRKPPDGGILTPSTCMEVCLLLIDGPLEENIGSLSGMLHIMFDLGNTHAGKQYGSILNCTHGRFFLENDLISWYESQVYDLAIRWSVAQWWAPPTPQTLLIICFIRSSIANHIDCQFKYIIKVKMQKLHDVKVKNIFLI